MICGTIDVMHQYGIFLSQSFYRDSSHFQVLTVTGFHHYTTGVQNINLAEDKFDLGTNEHIKFFDEVENIVGKGENVGNHYFL